LTMSARRSNPRCQYHHDGRVVTIGQLTLFSSETGDAWIIDRDDHLALRFASQGDSCATDKTLICALRRPIGFSEDIL
jgi:hypothetical protein